jgi:hypothetical protein
MRGLHIILETQIKRNVEGYIDDIVVKSKKRGDLLEDLKEIFGNLRNYKMSSILKMCIRCIIMEAARLHSVSSGHRR